MSIDRYNRVATKVVGRVFDVVWHGSVVVVVRDTCVVLEATLHAKTQV